MIRHLNNQTYVRSREYIQEMRHNLRLKRYTDCQLGTNTFQSKRSKVKVTASTYCCSINSTVMFSVNIAKYSAFIECLHGAVVCLIAIPAECH